MNNDGSSKGREVRISPQTAELKLHIMSMVLKKFSEFGEGKRRAAEIINDLKKMLS